jgi:signal peptidase II
MTEPRPSPSPRPGRSRLRNWAMLACLVLLLLAVDRLVKWLVVHNLAANESWAPIPALSKVFTITHVQNTGIAFGQLHGMGWVFMLANVIVFFAVLFYYPRIPAEQSTLRVASALILAGDLGNVIDRVRTIALAVGQVGSISAALSRAYVTDMFDFKIWPVFNVADMCLVAGILIVAWVMWRTESRAQKASEGAGSDDRQLAGDDGGNPH